MPYKEIGAGACIVCLLLLALPSCVRPYRPIPAPPPTLNVAPGYVCPNGEVTVSWNALHNSGSTDHRSTLAIGSDPPFVVDDPIGNWHGPISASTTFTFTASDGEGTRTATRFVQVISADTTLRIEGSAECGDRIVSLTREFPDQLDPNIRVMVVVAAGEPGRMYTIQHASADGAAVVDFVRGGSSSHRFDGMTLGGVWTISSALELFECCPGAGGMAVPDPNCLYSPPASLSMTVVGACSTR